MPPLDMVPSPAGRTVELASVVDERINVVLGKVDTLTIASGPDLVTHIEGELANTLSRMGFEVRQVDQSAPLAGHKRILPSLTGAELSSESTLLHPVAAAVRVRIEIIGEPQQSMFRKEIRGAVSRDLGRHKQGGPEDAQLMAEAVHQAFTQLAADESFIFAVNASPEDVAERRAAEEKARKATIEAAEERSMPREGQTANSVADRLGTLDRLLKDGLIDQNDYDQKRREILDDL